MGAVNDNGSAIAKAREALIWLDNSGPVDDLDATIKAAHANMRAAEATDLDTMVSQLAWHERMLAEYEASGETFSANEHRGWASECRANIEAITGGVVLARAA
jgi:hypothetical protein